jgi:hypothetical protein
MSLNELVQKVIEAAEGCSWKVRSALESRLVPHLMRQNRLTFDEATSLASTPIERASSELTNDDLSRDQIQEILHRNLDSYID